MGRAPQASHIAGPDHSYYPAKRTELGQLIMHFRNQMYQVKDHAAKEVIAKDQ